MESGIDSVTPTVNRRKLAVVLVAYCAFVVLAMSETQLGVAWPSMRDSFGVSLDSLGILLITSRIGLIVASFYSGRLTLYWGIGLLLLLGSGLRVLSVFGYALAPDWTAMVLISLVAGLGGGALGSALNTYFAVNHSVRLMNWLHASFGLGAMLGPIVMTAILNNGMSWRWGYVVAAVLQAIIALFLLLTLSDWRTDVDGSPPDMEQNPAGSTGSVPAQLLWRMPMLWLSLALFFVAAGIEATTGQWAFSLFTESRFIPIALAGFWVSVYWGSFTMGRIAFGFVADRLAYSMVMRSGILLTAGAALLLWANQGNSANFVAMAIMGLAQAPLSPLMISKTPERLGVSNVANAVGFQVGAASLGIALLPALAGVLAAQLGLESLAPFLLGLCLIFFVLHEVTLRRARRGLAGMS